MSPPTRLLSQQESGLLFDVEDEERGSEGSDNDDDRLWTLAADMRAVKLVGGDSGYFPSAHSDMVGPESLLEHACICDRNEGMRDGGRREIRDCRAFGHCHSTKASVSLSGALWAALSSGLGRERDERVIWGQQDQERKCP